MVTSYPQEKILFNASVAASVYFWLGLALVSVFVIDLYLPDMGLPLTALLLFLGFILVYAISSFRNAWRVASLRGHAVEIGAKQYPDLYTRLKAVCQRLQIDSQPTTYLFQSNRLPSSFHLQFGKQDFLALNAETIGALTDHQGAIDFLIGYELGRMHHRSDLWKPILFPATVLPLLGTGLARAQVYCYDRYGIEACRAKADAALALAVQASGMRRWKSFNIAEFATQSAAIRQCSMSFSELTSDSPWLSKRMATLRAIATNSEALIPRHSRLAYLFGLFVPHAVPTSLAGLARLLFIPLWIAVIGFTTVIGFEKIKAVGFYDSIAGFYQRLSTTRSETPKPLQSDGAPGSSATIETQTKENTRPYARLFADLKLLGSYARARQKKHGGIPCEIGNLSALRLNYRPERYAFSCDQPVVYSFVEQGEFEPGRPSHIRKYDWSTEHLILESAVSK
jgi:hypothetical protein